MGLVVVEGPNDAIRLNTLRVPAVALCSNTITQEQVERIAALASDLGAGCVTLMLDCDEEGINGHASSAAPAGRKSAGATGLVEHDGRREIQRAAAGESDSRGMVRASEVVEWNSAASSSGGVRLQQ